ncbi:hypothetical protein HAX54_022997 [Datura stramonium]|uniref:ABC transmembrane type-1 domain-containing protein n=1 Tax=Datura stramonium TaxID=4076 RepID=A0ABS8UVQ8_DATST|nr:hypothetical protein [Datura stramonium]
MAWSCPTGDAEPIAEKMNFILSVYVLLAVGSSLCVLVRSSFVAITGLQTAEKLFSNMLHSILQLLCHSSTLTPTGRILNRASTDQSVLDLEMANKLVTAVCIWYQQYYIPTARELALFI